MRKPVLAIRAVWSAPFFWLPRQYSTSSFYIQNLKPLASFCSWAVWFQSYLVENPEDRFSRDKAYVYPKVHLPGKKKKKNNKKKNRNKLSALSDEKEMFETHTHRKADKSNTMLKNWPSSRENLSSGFPTR